MTALPAPATTPRRSPLHWLNNQPYLLLSLTSLFWAANIVLARHVGSHVPPVTLTTIRWFGVFLILLPFAWPHLKRDWPKLRGALPLMLLLSAVGFAFNNAISYWAMQYTEALNALLIQSAGPLFVALWSLVILGVRLTLAQAFGVALSMCGVLIILLHGDLTTLSNIAFNKGDLIFIVALLIFALYSVLSLKRPRIHGLSVAAFTFGCGALFLVPFLIWELGARPVMQLTTTNLLSLFYVAVFPSTLAYLCFNRGVQLIGANRAAPFFHMVPVFGTVMSIVFIGEHPQAFHFIGFALVLAGVFAASRRPAAA